MDSVAVSEIPDKKNSKNKRNVWKEIRKSWPAYLFISPFYILFLVFGLIPIIFSGVLAFSKWDGIGEMEFVGVQNFAFLLQDTTFWLAMKNTIIIWVLNTVPMLSISLVLAYIINLKFIKHKEALKVLYFLPNITSVVSITIIFGLLFSNSQGLVNSLLIMLGFDPVTWLSDRFWVRVVIASIASWQYVGYNMIIYFTGLQKISHDYYEAAIVDGATTVQIFFKITLPLLRPIILFTVIMSTIGGLQVFTESFLLVPNALAEGGALTLVYYLYNTAFTNLNFGYGAAISWALVFLIVMFSIINSYLTSGRGGNK